MQASALMTDISVTEDMKNTIQEIWRESLTGVFDTDTNVTRLLTQRHLNLLPGLAKPHSVFQYNRYDGAQIHSVHGHVVTRRKPVDNFDALLCSAQGHIIDLFMNDRGDSTGDGMANIFA